MRYAIGVGSNIGNRQANIAAAADLLTDGIALIASSTLHETAPIGGPEGQGLFCNAVWIVATDLGPHQLLHRLQRIETALGRVRTVRWGPRTLDLDLLLRADGLLVGTNSLRRGRQNRKRRGGDDSGDGVPQFPAGEIDQTERYEHRHARPDVR